MGRVLHDVCYSSIHRRFGSVVLSDQKDIVARICWLQTFANCCISIPKIPLTCISTALEDY